MPLSDTKGMFRHSANFGLPAGIWLYLLKHPLIRSCSPRGIP